jgi:phenylalanyl-tRNA synthetase beta chain
VDVLREVDLIEEVARHCGFDRIPAAFPQLLAAPPPPDPRIAGARALRDWLTSQGFSEAVTFGFTSVAAAAATAFAAGSTVVPIRNPLSEAFAVLRPSLLPGLIESAGRNVRRGRRDVRLFEIGSRFTAESGETRALAFVWTGTGNVPHWSERPREVDFFDASGLVSAIVSAHDAAALFAPLASPPSLLVAGRSANVVASGADGSGGSIGTGEPIGLVGQLAPAVGELLDLPAEVPAYVAEIALDPLTALRRGALKASAPPRFPSVDRDVSILVRDTTAAGSVRETIRRLAIPTLVELREFDRYAGTGVPDGRVSLSLRLTFRAMDRTLTDADVQDAMDRVLQALAQVHDAVQR